MDGDGKLINWNCGEDVLRLGGVFEKVDAVWER